MNLFILKLDNTRRPEYCADALAAAVALADEHPDWRLVKKTTDAWELGTDESLEAVRKALPKHFTAVPMVTASRHPPAVTVEAIREAVSRRANAIKR